MTREEAKIFIESFIKLRNLATDEMSAEVPTLYPVWKTDTQYTVGDRVFYNEVLYKVLISHTAQADWTPDIAVSLFTKILIPNENVIPEWEQPNSTNPYMSGDKVTFNGQTWISTIDNNVWQPGVYGWEVA
jgi:hypothetical protein